MSPLPLPLLAAAVLLMGPYLGDQGVADSSSNVASMLPNSGDGTVAVFGRGGGSCGGGATTIPTTDLACAGNTRTKVRKVKRFEVALDSPSEFALAEYHTTSSASTTSGTTSSTDMTVAAVPECTTMYYGGSSRSQALISMSAEHKQALFAALTVSTPRIAQSLLLHALLSAIIPELPLFYHLNRLSGLMKGSPIVAAYVKRASAVLSLFDWTDASTAIGAAVRGFVRVVNKVLKHTLKSAAANAAQSEAQNHLKGSLGVLEQLAEAENNLKSSLEQVTVEHITMKHLNENNNGNNVSKETLSFLPSLF
jgi:hypothetical protein